MEQKKITDCFKALGDDTRIEIMEMLKGGTMCACKILEKFSMTQSTLSYHMKQLTDSGLVTVDKDWKWSYYTINVEVLNMLKQYLCFSVVSQPKCKCEE